MRIARVDIEMLKKTKISIDSNIEKMLPPRKSPRVPPMELSKSYIVNGSYLVTLEVTVKY